MSECKDGYSGLAIDCNQTARWKTVRPAPRLQGYSDSGALVSRLAEPARAQVRKGY